MEITYHEASFSPDLKELMQRLRIKPDSAIGEEFLQLYNEAKTLGKPRGAFVEAELKVRGAELRFGGTVLRGDILQAALASHQYVYPFLATCGMELERWADKLREPLHRYWASEIMVLALGAAVQGIKDQLVSLRGKSEIAVISPGAREGWPLSEQTNLFRILKDAPRRLGVRLTDDLLMLPLKTLSGIMVPTEKSMSLCVFCDKEHCSEKEAVQAGNSCLSSNPSCLIGDNTRSG